MHSKFVELGDVKFVINVGDSFYPNGVESKTDPQWDEKWRSRYSAELRSVPWYSVYGNHDLHKDPCNCAEAPDACAQVNGNTTDRNFFYMPSYTWSLEHRELGVEIIAMDMNHYVWGWRGPQAEPWFRNFNECSEAKCGEQKCKQIQERRAKESIELFNRRLTESTA